MTRINPEIDSALEVLNASDEDKKLIKEILGYEIQNNTSGGNSTLAEQAIVKMIDELDNTKDSGITK